MKRRGSYPWKAIIKRLRKRPGSWQLMLPDVPVRLVSSIRLRRHPDLRVDDGRLEPLSRNEYRTPDGQLRCDVWVRFIPTE